MIITKEILTTTVAQNNNLHSAKRNKNDEFYTQLPDIEKELSNYKKHFKDKVVYCNCDTEESNFYKYFVDNYTELGLKGLLRSSLADDIPFQSEVGIKLLKQADIVCSNPPFSSFCEYTAQLIEHDKRFLIIGNFNAVTYKEIFPLIKNNKMWLGVSPRSMSFVLPSGDIKQVNACWYTNLQHKKRNAFLTLFKSYNGNEKDYPKYDNYDIIEVSKTVDIPLDYKGAMGVPISFLDKYNPKQFKIIGCSYSYGKPEGYHNDGDRFGTSIDGKQIYKRFFIIHI